MTATYQLDPVTVSLTARAISSGTLSNTYIACSSGCPTSTSTQTTINYNNVPGRFYLDANVNYSVDVGDTTKAQLFFSVKNMFNATVPPVPEPFLFNYTFASSLYDPFGVVYRADVRFQM